jgi:hypothetical protein
MCGVAGEDNDKETAKKGKLSIQRQPGYLVQPGRTQKYNLEKQA